VQEVHERDVAFRERPVAKSAMNRKRVGRTGGVRRIGPEREQVVIESAPSMEFDELE